MRVAVKKSAKKLFVIHYSSGTVVGSCLAFRILFNFGMAALFIKPNSFLSKREWRR
jgi:hypothetical protein